MNQENEQPPTRSNQYVILDLGSRSQIAMPLDSFIELSNDFVVLETEGYGDEMTYSAAGKPTNFKLVPEEFIMAARVKAKMLKDA
jgi:hypothetical protein